MIDKLKQIAGSFAEDSSSDAIYPAHLFRALLHKELGLIKYIESDLDKDYYFLVDWAEIQMSMAPKALRPTRDLALSDESVEVLEEAESYRAKLGKDAVDGICVLASLVTPGVGFSFDNLKTLPLSVNEIMGGSAKTAVPEPCVSNSQKSSKGTLSDYCIDMLAEIRNGNYDPVVGFDNEREMMCEVLGRKSKANLLILGEAGVGKTALVQSFILALAEAKVPDFLRDCNAYELDITALSSDAQYKGEVEDRLKKVISELSERRNALLVIEGIDKFFDKNGNLFGASELLKQTLSKGSFPIIGTASIEGYTKNIEVNKEMLNKFEKFTVEEPDADLAFKILRGSVAVYEDFHGLTADDETLREAIRLAKRYLNERSLPDTAFDLIDRAMAHLRTRNNKNDGTPRYNLSATDLCEVVAEKTGVPLGKVETQERDRLMGAEDTLKQRVIGQDHAVKKVIDAVFESRSGLQKKGQPMGSFFFLGPTGTGKTELSKSLAAFLFGDESALIRFDMSEFKEEHSVALLYGAPPGYVGYEEGGLLVNKIRQNPYSVVLFDEIEKAHKSVFDLFLQILDEGKLHDRLGRVGDFSNALILFTSNIGSKYVVEQFNKGNIPTGTEMMEIMQDYFRPEFLGRLTEIVPFSPITEQSVLKIFDIHLRGLLKLLDEQNISLSVTDEAKHNIAMRGFNPEYGARPILGIIRKEIRNPLSKLIIRGEIKPGDNVVLYLENDEINFKKN